MIYTPRQEASAAARIRRTEAYAEKIRRMFAATANDLARLAKTYPSETGVMYSFDCESRKTRREVEALLRRLHSSATLAIEKGITNEWNMANAEYDHMLRSIFDKNALASPRLLGAMSRNDEARKAFINRSDSGMNLSDRIWRTTRQLRDEMEVAITVGIGEGLDAASMARGIKQYLNDPDLMFRRFRYKEDIPVRDESGEVIGYTKGEWKKKWKKRIDDPDNPGRHKWIDYDKDTYQDDWTGRGYYKSSTRNAMRVARTETNIAYRRADHERWQQMDFVKGQEIKLSKSHPAEDICDTLQGKYPKEFIFDGWHPQCFCYALPILCTEKEMSAINHAIINDEEYDAPGQITDYPQGFRDWVRDNKENIIASQKNGSAPYFVQDNAGIIDGILDSMDEEKDRYLGQGLVGKVQDKINSKKFGKLKTPEEVIDKLSESLEKNLGYNVEIEYNADYHNIDSLKAQATEIERLTRRYNLRQAPLGKIVFGYNPSNTDEYGSVNFDGNSQKILWLTPYFEKLYQDIAMSKSRCKESRMHLSVTTHEFGHLIYQIRGVSKPDFKLFENYMRAIYDEYITEFDALSHKKEFERRAEMFIGQYGHKHINDFIAECFQEYMNCTQPSPYAMKVGKLIDMWFKH